MPCEGGVRNVVYAACNGWLVHAFDTSEAGKVKALKLADKNGVNIHYTIEDAATAIYPENSADAVAFIYAHFPPVTRQLIHQKATGWLKPGGKIIIEAFNPKQLQNTSGGPQDISMLYTEDIIKTDFQNIKTEYLQSLQTTLKEGKNHQGKADIIRFIGTKL